MSDEHRGRRVVEGIEDADDIIVFESGDDTVGKGGFGFRDVMLDAVDKDGGHGSTLLRLDTDIGIVEEGGNGGVDEILLAAGTEEAVGCGVADFGIGDLGIDID